VAKIIGEIVRVAAEDHGHCQGAQSKPVRIKTRSKQEGSAA
jgi:hypothetical protein